MTIPKVFHLSDRAIVLYFALRELGPMSSRELCLRLNKSHATIYRAMQELGANGLLPAKRTTYAIPMTSDLAA